jgi:DNA-binding GntR family transcriptional regulator
MNGGSGSAEAKNLDMDGLYESLVALVRSGGSGAPWELPSESEIVRRFGCNRFAARRCLLRLSEEGLVHPLRNRSFVAGIDRKDITVKRNASYTASMLRSKQAPRSRLVEIGLEAANKEISRELGLQRDDIVWSLTYARFRESLLSSLSSIYIPRAAAPGLDRFIGEDKSLYKVLLAHYGILPLRVRTVCEAISADARLSRAMMVPFRFPILRTRNTAVWGKRPVEYSITNLRSDLFRVRFDLDDSGVDQVD